jgi:NADPH:quinone reductase-like Zn-dependent oxidoreductase
MKAIVCHRYGSPDVLDLQEVDPPVVGDHQVLVRVRAASVSPSDWHLLSADPFFVRLMRCGLLRPRFKILGADIAGEAEPRGSASPETAPRHRRHHPGGG